jgi:hypothetical protein
LSGLSRNCDSPRLAGHCRESSRAAIGKGIAEAMTAWRRRGRGLPDLLTMCA